VWNFVDSLPEGSLDAWYRTLTFLAIGIPILGALIGGVCGWGAFVVSGRISDLQTAAVHDLRDPRQLRSAQRNAVAEKIRPFAGTGFVAWVQLEPESIGFLNILEGVLKDGGWQPHPPVPPAPTVNLPNLVPVGQSVSFSGMRIWFDGSRNPSLRPAAEALNSALRAEAISTTLDDDAFSDGADPSFITIQIGEKPHVSQR
jgi:hypothetical protein